MGDTIDVGTAMTGVDAEVGYSLPVRERHVVRAFVGAYHFEPNSGSVSDVNGVKVRVEGVINNGVTAQALYTNDNLYGSNVMVGLSLQFPFGNNHPTSGWGQHTPSPFRFVERNYNVIVSQRNDTSSESSGRRPNDWQGVQSSNKFMRDRIPAPRLYEVPMERPRSSVYFYRSGPTSGWRPHPRPKRIGRE